MNNKQKFIKFLESLKGKGKGQDTLIESVKQGFKACMESDYQDIEDFSFF